MMYLFLQIWVWLVVAFLLGWVSHWFCFSRGKSKQTLNSQRIGDEE